MAKKVITSEQAEDMLMAAIESEEWADDVYGLVKDKFQEFVERINEEHNVTDVDGNVINDDNNDGEEWYNTTWDVFMQSAFDAIRNWLNK